MTTNHDFDAWRAARAAARAPETITLFDVEVPVPTSITVDLAFRIDEADIDDRETVNALVEELYGAGELKRWREGGCDLAEFGVLLAWGSARAQGEEIDFDRAAEIVAERREGKAPEANRAERRAGKKRRR